MNVFYKVITKILRIVENELNKQTLGYLKFCGKNVRIHPSCHILVPQQMEVGDNTSISSYTTIYAAFGVKIGNNCLISSNCGISSINHIVSSSNRYLDDYENVNFSKPVSIGDNVWIGMNACILPGVTIGNNSIVGSGSVVTKNIPSNEIWVGNPAKFIKRVCIYEAGESHISYK